MSYTKITLRYAAAFFDLATERGVVEIAYEDMKLLGTICNTNQEFVRMLQNPVIHADKKAKIVSKIFESSVNKTTLAFMNLMVRKRRERYLPSIADAYADLYDASKGITKAYVTSAIDLTASEKNGVQQILGRLTDMKINLIEKTNPELIGGFVANLGHFQVDQSIASKIKELKKDFEKNLYIKGY